MKNNILILLALLLFAACQKQPTANFNTDKTFYYAGETVHLTDASTNAHHWLWTLPDGTTSNNQNVDFVIDSNEIGGDKTFSLTVTSKNGNKLSTISKTVRTSQPIYASDFFSSLDLSGHSSLFTKDIPQSKTVYEGTDYINFSAELDYGYVYDYGYNEGVYITLGGTTLSTILSGTYTLKYNTALTSGEASAFIAYDQLNPDFRIGYNAIGGQVNVVVSNHNIHLTFNNVRAMSDFNGARNDSISSDLIFRK